MGSVTTNYMNNEARYPGIQKNSFRHFLALVVCFLLLLTGRSVADYIYVTSAANEGYSKTIHNNFFPLILKGTLSDEPSGPDDFEPSGERIESSSLPEPGQLEESFPYISFQFKIDRKLNLKFEQEGTSDPVKRKSIRKYRYQQKEEKDKLIKCAFIRAGPSVNKPTGNTSFS